MLLSLSLLSFFPQNSYDEGSIIIKVGREEPAMSMDVNGGKIVWARHSEMQQVNLKALPEGKYYIAIA